MQSILEIIIPISIVLTVGIMFTGTFTMTKAEDGGRKSNMMMRYRVLSQFISILLIILYVWIRS
ncbi:twin transmembrane helix small protein [Emcibacteraceae bacterium]|nr:twin transmembrane helix small protein [Emcibacteraceae bacterium]MDC0080914.1 twin transmembrane helix small protein [Emcibacteraceae bacterium]